MDIVSSYTRPRRDFGRPCCFSDKGPDLIADIKPSRTLAKQFVVRNPVNCTTQVGADKSEHEVNTTRKTFDTTGMVHTEGGWPKDIDNKEVEQKIRYRKKVEKDETFVRSVQNLGQMVEGCLRQNNSIDVFEEYFSGGSFVDHSSEPPGAKTLTVFRDPSPVARTATTLSWFPNDPKRIAVAYSILQFQKMPAGVCTNSYVWDVNNSNHPEMELASSSPLCCLEYNPRDPHVLVGGAYNGIVAFWDDRKGSHVVDSSLIDKSHRDPIYKVVWLQSKTGTECATVSTDGSACLWDTRKLSEPIESLTLESKDESGMIYGGVTLEYDAAAGPAKFLVGTEQGAVLLCNRKAKNPQDRIGSRFTGHHGPVTAVKRNPFAPKYFLTAGDWTTRVWAEDLKVPLITSKYNASYVTDAGWSPTRANVFFTTKMDGSLDVWDFFYKHNDPVLSLQMNNTGLHTIRVQEEGKLLAVGGVDGTTTLLEISDGLSVGQANEKASLLQMLERETNREKTLEVRARELRQKERRKAEGDGGREELPSTADDDELAKADKEFWYRLNNPGGGDMPGEEEEH